MLNDQHVEQCKTSSNRAGMDCTLPLMRRGYHKLAPRWRTVVCSWRLVSHNVSGRSAMYPEILYIEHVHTVVFSAVGRPESHLPLTQVRKQLPPRPRKRLWVTSGL